MQPHRTFYQTTAMSKEALMAAVSACEEQDAAVLKIYRETGKPWGPSQIHTACTKVGKKWLLTSIRRSITNLTKAGKLVKLDATRPGPFGKPEGLWKANPDNTSPLPS